MDHCERSVLLVLLVYNLFMLVYFFRLLDCCFFSFCSKLYLVFFFFAVDLLIFFCWSEQFILVRFMLVSYCIFFCLTVIRLYIITVFYYFRCVLHHSCCFVINLRCSSISFYGFLFHSRFFSFISDDIGFFS